MDSNLKVRSEDELIIFLCRDGQFNESRMQIKSLSTADFDWNYFFKTVLKHKITPIIYSNLKKHADLIPNDVYINLREFFNNNAKKNLFLLMELIKIIELFEKNKVAILSYKGPILAYMAYGDISLRQFSDLDFLVYSNEFKHAKELLESIGYESELDLDEFQEIKFIESQQEMKFFNSQKNITVDLHWKFSLLHSMLKCSLTQRTTLINLHNRLIRSLQLEEMFLIICIHNSSHRWSNLSLLCDLCQFVSRNKNIDWRKIESMAKKMGLKRIFIINILLIKNIFDLDLSHNLNDSEEDLIAEDIVNQIQKNILKESKFSLCQELIITIQIRENMILGLQDVITNLFKATSYEWKKIPLPAQISFAYKFIRPFLLLTRYHM